MAKSREIKTRIKAVKNIQRITRTMQMIATSKFSRAQSAALSSKPYTEGLFDLVRQLSSRSEGISHPLLAGGDEGHAGEPSELTLVLTSERGLCGPYNANIVRTALRHIRENEPAQRGPVELVGKKGLAAMRFAKVEIAQYHTQFGDKPQYEDIEALAQAYIDRFEAGEVSAVRVIYMKYISAGKQVPEILPLLPFESGELTEASEDEHGREGFNSSYEFSPSGAELLDTLLPAAVKAVLFQCFNDAIVSEHVARMVAMKAATDNAGKMSKTLKRRFNRARQAQITTELTEIVSGAQALG